MKEDDEFCYACGAPVAKVVKEELSVSADNLIGKVKELKTKKERLCLKYLPL